ncbi:MAG: helix-turn-helix domain-containing protein [Pyrinomonadaceae bacterium]
MDYDIRFDGDEPVPFIPESEAARLLKISPETLQRIRYAGEIQFYRVGGRVFYLPQNLNEFIRRCRQGGDE